MLEIVVKFKRILAFPILAKMAVNVFKKETVLDVFAHHSEAAKLVKFKKPMFVIQILVPMADHVKIMLETMDFSVCVVQVNMGEIHFNSVLDKSERQYDLYNSEHFYSYIY